jgi:hypothetical protein
MKKDPESYTNDMRNATYLYAVLGACGVSRAAGNSVGDKDRVMLKGLTGLI